MNAFVTYLLISFFIWIVSTLIIDIKIFKKCVQKYDDWESRIIATLITVCTVNFIYIFLCAFPIINIFMPWWAIYVNLNTTIE